MHEMSLCLSMIDLVCERVRAEGAHRVLRIKLTIGALARGQAQEREVVIGQVHSALA